MELGCGIGLPSIVALAGGASALATDHYEAALDFAAYNARAQTGRELETAYLDWRSPEKASLKRFDRVLAADVLYEPRNQPLLADLVEALLDTGGEAVFADPRRKDTPAFLDMMQGRGFVTATGSTLVENGDKKVEVRLHRLWRG